LATLWSETFNSSFPWRPLSAANALGLRSSELFSRCVVEKSFHSSLSVLALFYKTFQPRIGASTAYSHSTSRVPFVASQRIRSGRDHSCSLELFDLLGFHFFGPLRRSSSSSHFPFVLFSPSSLTKWSSMNHRVFCPQKIGVSHYRVPTYLAFFTGTLHNLFGRSTYHGLFFHLKVLKTLTSL
jgi:hypothetical protein